MPAHAHWRLFFDQPSAVALAEIAFLSVGGANLCQGGTASASSFNQGKPPSAAFDGLPVEYGAGWVAASLAAGPHWIAYAFAAPVEVAKVQLLHYYGPSDTAYIPLAGLIFLEFSDDGVLWERSPKILLANRDAAVNNRVTYSLVESLSMSPPAASLTVLGVSRSREVNASVQVAVPHTEAPSVRFLQEAPLFGTGTLSGTLKVGALPSRRLVRLFERGSGRLVRQTMSEPNGAYRFDQLDTARQYFAVGFDDPVHFDPVYNAAIADMLRPGVEGTA